MMQHRRLSTASTVTLNPATDGPSSDSRRVSRSHSLYSCTSHRDGAGGVRRDSVTSPSAGTSTSMSQRGTPSGLFPSLPLRQSEPSLLTTRGVSRTPSMRSKSTLPEIDETEGEGRPPLQLRPHSQYLSTDDVLQRMESLRLKNFLHRTDSQPLLLHLDRRRSLLVDEDSDEITEDVKGGEGTLLPPFPELDTERYGPKPTRGLCFLPKVKNLTWGVSIVIVAVKTTARKYSPRTV